ncbi:MAG TPA: hypothetical protein VGD02_07670 [Gemmatimonadaceae bacterium]|jgi:hypothetical protein
MIRLNCFLIAEYATLSPDSKLVIAGTFDSLEVQRKSPPPENSVLLVPFPRATIAIVTEASLADGLAHKMRLRIIDGNGKAIVEDLIMEMAYTLNQFGRPLRNNMLVNIQGLQLPGPDDYVFELFVDDNPKPLGEFAFFVTESVSPS